MYVCVCVCVCVCMCVCVTIGVVKLNFSMYFLYIIFLTEFTVILAFKQMQAF